MVRQWHRLHRDAVDAPFLEVLKARLGTGQPDLVGDSPPVAGG